MAGQNNAGASGGNSKLRMGGWPTERIAAVIVIGALGLLILIRLGFRGGVNLSGGVSAGVS